MFKKLIFLVCILLVSVPVFGQAEFDYENVIELRWMDPYGRKPITYQEYVQARKFIGGFDAQLVFVGSKGDIPICIVINNLLEPSIQGSFSVYVSDLEAEGYAVNVYTASNNGDEVALKNLIITEFNSRGIVGAILIGDLPVAWYEMEEPRHQEFPIDLFFMDLDGDWMDGDFDGLYDDHTDGTGDIEADIWVGRLSAFNLTEHSANEIILMNTYFDKNHDYRMGEFRLLDKALAYIDDDWSSSTWEEDVALAYPTTEAVKAPFVTTREDYMQRVRESTNNQYENLLICAHSSPWVHGLFWGPGPQEYSFFFNHEIEEIDVQAIFYNLFACSNCRYVEQDDMGNWYIFQSTYGLLSVGSTKTGSMLCFEDYYEPLGNGASFGEAFLDWCISNMETCAGSSSHHWFYGMTLLGDPTLRLSRFIAFGYGDANGDGEWSVSDAVYLINYLFKGGPAPIPVLQAGDCNCDGDVAVADVVYLINYLFKGGPPPGC